MKRSLVILAAFATPAFAQSPAPRAEVLVLGVYHMANPGRDIFNTRADDVLAPKRQQEIAELARVLEKFAPTKVAQKQARMSPFLSQRRRICAVNLIEEFSSGRKLVTLLQIIEVPTRPQTLTAGSR